MDLYTIINPDDVGGIPRRFSGTGDRMGELSGVTAAQGRRSTRARDPPVQSLTASESIHIHAPAAKSKPGVQRPSKRRKVIRAANPVAGPPDKSVPAFVANKRRRHQQHHRQPHNSHLAATAGISKLPPLHTSSRSSLSPPSSEAREVLRLARETAQLDLDILGRRPFIMDVILDEQPAVKRYSEDALMDAIESRRQQLYSKATHSFRNRQDLADYWAGQSALWRGTQTTDADDRLNRSSETLYRVSAERSTASWDPALDADREKNVDSRGDGQEAGSSSGWFRLSPKVLYSATTSGVSP